MKIILKSEYELLLDCFDKCKDLQAEVDALKHERKAMMKELAATARTGMGENAKAQSEKKSPAPENNAKKHLPGDYEVICSASRPCDGCPDETDTCKKIYVDGGTVCVDKKK